MGAIYDKLLGEMVLHNHVKFVSSDPASANEGDWILNTTNHTIKIYYSGAWRTLHTISIEDYYLLLETGDFLLQENGDKIIL